MDGFINVLKPPGPTASDIVVRLRRILGQKKIGHLGTLDPGAAGVLPVAVGKGTKLFDFLTFKKKKYRAFVTFGSTTDTLDSFGAVTEEKNFVFNEQNLREALADFVGVQMQVPPVFSALSINGTRAYNLARKGVEFEIPARKVEIFSFELVGRIEENVFCIDIECSGGTYIRSLCRDLAQKIGTVGFMSGLIRTCSGLFDLKDAITLGEIANDPDRAVLPLLYPLGGLKEWHADDTCFRDLSNGVKIRCTMPEIEIRKVFCKGEFWGLGHNENGQLKLDYFLR